MLYSRLCLVRPLFCILLHAVILAELFYERHTQTMIQVDINVFFNFRITNRAPHFRGNFIYLNS